MRNKRVHTECSPFITLQLVSEHFLRTRKGAKRRKQTRKGTGKSAWGCQLRVRTAILTLLVPKKPHGLPVSRPLKSKYS